MHFHTKPGLPPFIPEGPPPALGFRLDLCNGWVTYRRVKNAFWHLYRFGEHPDLLSGCYVPSILIAFISGFLPADQRRTMLSYDYSATIADRVVKVAQAMLRADNYNCPSQAPGTQGTADPTIGDVDWDDDDSQEARQCPAPFPPRRRRALGRHYHGESPRRVGR